MSPAPKNSLEDFALFKISSPRCTHCKHAKLSPATKSSALIPSINTDRNGPRYHYVGHRSGLAYSRKQYSLETEIVTAYFLVTQVYYTKGKSLGPLAR
jgi:hypothetical protein